jgi:hypothetical protein
MTDPGPFVPPGRPLSPSTTGPSATPQPSAIPAPTLPPPTGAPIGVVQLPSLPPPPRRRRWLIPVIIGGSLLLAGLITGVAFLAISLATWAGNAPSALSPDGREPEELSAPDELVEGDPGDPVASDPLDCVACFATADVYRIDVPDGAYARLGLPVDDRQPFDVPLFTDQRQHVEWWEDDGGSPDPCFFAYTAPPLLFEPDHDVIMTSDQIVYAASHSAAGGDYRLTEASRVFVTNSTASAYVPQLEEAVDGCPEYSLTGAGYAAEVTPAPAFEVPDDVAAYGWVETAGLSRFYAADVQRGNIITRLSLFSDSRGPSEQQFRALVEEYAQALADLEP